MRATRAYVAGFGTAGSLLAGASIMFVLASAVVSFRGWPQIAVQSAPATLQTPRAHAATTAASRRLVVAARRVSTIPSTRPATGSRGAAVAVAPRPSSAVRPSTPTHRVSTAPIQSAGGGAAPPPVVVLPPRKPVQTLTTVVQGTTHQLGGTVSTVGQTLGSTVNNVVGAVANVLSGTPLGGTVRSLGNALGGTLTATGAALGALLGQH